MLSRNSIDGSVKWLDVPDFMGTDGPPWNSNILDPYASWGDRGSSTNPNWGSQYGGHFDIFSVLWTRLVRVYLVYHHMFFENMRSAARLVCDSLL